MHDIAMSPSGDLIPNGSGGLSEVDANACDLQDANYRLLTNDWDHLLWAIGANLEDLIGLPNCAATAIVGEKSITAGLTGDGRFGTAVGVGSVPIAANAIEFSISLPSGIYTISPAVLTTVVALES